MFISLCGFEFDECWWSVCWSCHEYSWLLPTSNGYVMCADIGCYDKVRR